MRSAIQEKIAQYLGSEPQAGNMWHSTLTCFVGMIETGEATIADFRAVGGAELAEAVGLRRALSNLNETRCKHEG
jgi:hypothetical protein